MVIAREQRNQGEQHTGYDGDPALQVESKQHRSQPDRPTINNTPVLMPLLGPGRQKPVSVCHWHTPDLVSEGPKKGRTGKGSEHLPGPGVSDLTTRRATPVAGRRRLGHDQPADRSVDD